MKVVTKNSYDAINDFRTSCVVNNLNDSFFYRGTKTKHLLPSIIRRNNKLTAKELSIIESEMFEEFKSIYTETINKTDETAKDWFDKKDEITKDWFYRIKAREHGLANRLMDWTHTFYKALDFATYNVSEHDSEKYVYLWMLVIEPHEVLYITDYKYNPFQELKKSVFLPNVNPAGQINLLASHRQAVQGGSFLVQPTDLITIPIDEQDFFGNKLVCIQVPVECADDIRNDIILKAGEIIDQSIMIKESDIDEKCKKLNDKFLYSVN